MSWRGELNATTLSGVTTEAAFQREGADWKIELNPGEVYDTEVKANTEGTDDVDVTFYSSSATAPGAVPDAGTPLAASDWSIYNAIKISDADQDDEWQGQRISGIRWLAVTCARDGSTDTPDCDLRIQGDGVDAQ